MQTLNSHTDTQKHTSTFIWASFFCCWKKHHLRILNRCFVMSFFFVFSFGLAKVAASLSLGFCFVFSKLPKFFNENNIHSYFFGTHRIGWQSASQPASRYDDAFALNVNSSKECLLYFAFYVNALEFAIQAFNQSFLYRQMTHTGTHTTASTMRIHREYHEHLNL